MRVALLTTSFPRFDGDVAGSFVLGFARGLVARGHTVRVLAPEPAQALDAAPSWPGVKVSWVPYLRPRRFERTFYGAGVLDNLRRDPGAWPGLGTYPFALMRAARRDLEQADALVSHWALPSALVAGAVAQGRPHLAVLHSADVHLLERLPGRHALASRITDGATAIQCVSAQLRDRFLALVPSARRDRARDKVHVLSMGVEAAPRTGSERSCLRHHLGMHGFTAVFVGRLVPIKGLDDAIRAVARPDARGASLVIAGAGPERARLERLARSLDAPVRFAGEVRGTRKWELLRAADVFVAPSRMDGRTEGTPVSVLEAMAAGLPVIATASGGLAEVVGHESTGLRVPAAAPHAIAHALARLQHDHALREAARRRAEERASAYRWPVRAMQIERLLVAGA